MLSGKRSVKETVFALIALAVLLVTLFLATQGGTLLQPLRTGRMRSASAVVSLKPDAPTLLFSPSVGPTELNVPAPNSTTLPVRPDTLFAMAFGYAGQQGSSALSLSTFQCFISALHEGKSAVISHPTFRDSTFYSWGNALKNFSSLFDLAYFNAESRRLGYPEMMLEDFDKYRPKHVIFVLVRGLGRGSVEKLVWNTEIKPNRSEVKCLVEDDIQNFTDPYKGKLKGMLNKCVVRAVELYCICCNDFHKKNKTSLDHVQEFIFGGWPHHEVTLIFSYWAFYVHPPMTTPCVATQQRVQFRPSKEILEEATLYKKKFLGGENKLTMMIRVERIERAEKSKEKAEKCFNKATALRNKLMGKSNPNMVVTMDLGKYGSGTYSSNNTITALARKTFASLYGNKWSIEEWEKSFIVAAGGVTDRGYIGALQRVLASRAECLVLVGGGDFQTMAAVDFMMYHRSKDCIHLVCVQYPGIQGIIEGFDVNYVNKLLI